MNVVQFNITYKSGSTGKIVSDLSDVMGQYGINSFIVSGYKTCEASDKVYFVNDGNIGIECRRDIFISRLTGKTGYRNKWKTQKIIEWVKRCEPDIIHLHNIHGDWIHLETLFEYIKKNKIPVVWTLHDCWSFTGRCSYFEPVGCTQWESGCIKCPSLSIYPKSYFFDWSETMWRDKKKWLLNLDMHIVTPSQWLANYVKRSFLQYSSLEVIHNGIDTDVYHPVSERSMLLNNASSKKIILGVCNSWSKRKGFYDFFALNNIIDHEKYKIVMVGLKHRDISKLPASIIGLERTENQHELVKLYSSADVFVNPTYADNFPTTNLEAICCGTPVLTYNTGGSPEGVISSDYVGAQGDVRWIYEKIKTICGESPVDRKILAQYGKASFDKRRLFKKYISKYLRIKDGEL